MNKLKNQKGFTLVELMVVIVIIGILAGMAIPKVLGATSKAKLSEFKPILKEIYTLQTAYQTEQGVFSDSALHIGFATPSGKTRFDYGVSKTVTAIGTAKTTEAIGEVELGKTASIDENGILGSTDPKLAGIATIKKL